MNVAELLKDCPKGMELDCVLWDNVTFERVADDGIWVNHIDSKGCKRSSYLYNDGSFPMHLGSLRTKCIIFPKGKTTWDGFQRPFNDGDVVTYNIRGSLVAFIYKNRINTTHVKSHFALYTKNMGFSVNGSIALKEKEIVFATEEEKQRLFAAIKAAGYRWNPETKTLEKSIEPIFKVGDRIRLNSSKFIGTITAVLKDRYRVTIDSNDFYEIEFERQGAYKLVPRKFDVRTLKPFDKVLVRPHHMAEWKVDFFSHYTEGANFPYNTAGNSYNCYCIPFKGNECLCGTTEDCNNFYKTWEE